MNQLTQDEIEERVKNLVEEKLPEAKQKYLELQNQLLEAQGFVSMKIQTQVEIAKNEYIALNDELVELKNILSYMDEEG